MLQIFDEYNPNANPPSTDYPNGSGRDESVSGANDGTPLEMGWYNDMLGFSEALLGEGRLTPSGNADTALVSDRLDGFRLAALRVQTVCDFTNGDLTLVDVIHVGLDITTVEYVIDRNSLTRWSTSGTTGTVTADDLNTTTGALSGVSGMLTQINPLNSNNNLSDVADASLAFDNIKQSATETETGVAREATQAEVDARSGGGFVTSSKLPNVASDIGFKVNFDGTGATPIINSSYNVLSVTRSSTGLFIITYLNSLSEYTCISGSGGGFEFATGTSQIGVIAPTVQTANSVEITVAKNGDNGTAAALINCSRTSVIGV